jgi:hypothetical protein
MSTFRYLIVYLAFCRLVFFRRILFIDDWHATYIFPLSLIPVPLCTLREMAELGIRAGLLINLSPLFAFYRLKNALLRCANIELVAFGVFKNLAGEKGRTVV